MANIDPQTLLDVQNAKFIIKIYPNKRPKKDWLAMETKVLEDSSIGIHYGLPESFVKYSNQEEMMKRSLEIKPENTSSRSRYPALCNQFINEMKTGDKILIARGENKILYTATISSDCYFTQNSKWEDGEFNNRQVGWFHRRHITNIRRLPPGTKCSNKYRDTISKIRDSFQLIFNN